MRRLAISISLLCALSLALGASIASASAAPHGVLSSSEYSQLKQAMNRLPAAVNAGHWVAATAICNGLNSATRVLVAEKQDCRADVGFFAAAAKLDTAPAHCDKHAEPAQRAKCLSPSYRRLAEATASLYRLEGALHAVVLARGFKGGCVSILSNTERALGAEHRLVTDTRQMAESTANFNGVVLLSASRAFQKDIDTLQAADSGLSSLSVCPHRGSSPGQGIAAAARA